MAATSTSDPLQEENERFEDELVARFTDPVQTSTLLLKWLNATSALRAAQDQPAYASARAKWADCCRLMGKLNNFETVCNMLDGLTATLVQPETVVSATLVQPETVVTQKKRKKAASAATVRGHKESAFEFGHTREQASLPTYPSIYNLLLLQGLALLFQEMISIRFHSLTGPALV